MKNLKVTYNNSLRRLLGLPSHNSASGMFVNMNILSFLGNYSENMCMVLDID